MSHGFLIVLELYSDLQNRGYFLLNYQSYAKLEFVKNIWNAWIGFC